MVCTDSNKCRTCYAHAPAHSARSRWSKSLRVPPRRMVMKRGSRILGRIMVLEFPGVQAWSAFDVVQLRPMIGEMNGISLSPGLGLCH